MHAVNTLAGTCIYCTDCTVATRIALWLPEPLSVLPELSLAKILAEATNYDGDHKFQFERALRAMSASSSGLSQRRAALLEGDHHIIEFYYSYSMIMPYERVLDTNASVMPLLQGSMD